jgi:hypothetical protein
MPSHFLSDPGEHVTDGRRKPLATPGRRDTPVIESACDGPQRGSAARLQLGDHRRKPRAQLRPLSPQLLATALGGDERCLGAIRDEAGLELNLRAICFSMKRPAVPSI